MARNPFLDAYAARMEEAFGDNYGVEDDPFGDYLAGLSDEAKAAFRQRKQQHPGVTRSGFFSKSAYSPERLQAQFDAYGGGTPGGGWDRRPNRGDPIGPVEPGPDDPLNDLWRSDKDTQASWQRHMAGLGFDNQGATNFDDWRNQLYSQAELDWREAMKTPGQEAMRFPAYLTDQYGQSQAIRDRYFSMSPERRGETGGTGSVRWSYY